MPRPISRSLSPQVYKVLSSLNQRTPLGALKNPLASSKTGQTSFVEPLQPSTKESLYKRRYSKKETADGAGDFRSIFTQLGGANKYDDDEEDECIQELEENSPPSSAGFIENTPERRDTIISQAVVESPIDSDSDDEECQLPDIAMEHCLTFDFSGAAGIPPPPDVVQSPMFEEITIDFDFGFTPAPPIPFISVDPETPAFNDIAFDFGSIPSLPPPPRRSMLDGRPGTGGSDIYDMDSKPDNPFGFPADANPFRRSLTSPSTGLSMDDYTDADGSESAAESASSLADPSRDEVTTSGNAVEKRARTPKRVCHPS
jgi:hypothetical protein